MARHLWQGILVISVAFGAVADARAFGGSEEERWKWEVKEAKARANDFRQHLGRTTAADRDREEAATEAKKARVRGEVEDERALAAFIKERDAKPDPGKLEDKREKEFERIQALDAREMESSRQGYVRVRNRVREVLKRDAHIDEALEYGLRYDPTTRAKPKGRGK